MDYDSVSQPFLTCYPKSYSDVGSLLPPTQSHTNNMFHINAHLFCPLKDNKWYTTIINFNLTVVINATAGPVFPLPVYAQWNILWLKH